MQESPSEVVTPPTAAASAASTVTFLFTDIEGSTSLWEAHADEMAQALARHDVILRSAVESNGGQVVKTTGDGLFAAFGSAHDAIAAAMAGQVALGQASWEPIGPLRVRMGLHTGDAVLVEGDYHGPAVNRAARLTTAGHGGQVLVSGATASLVMDRLPTGAELVALGEHRLRDLGRPEVLYQLVHPELVRVFPPLRTLDSYPTNLPLPVSSFVGRERELGRVVAALDDARVVTLTGVGGVGKTRLALQVAARVLPQFREGAWMVELAPVRDSGGVPGAFAAVFAVSARSGMTLEQSLAEFLRTKRLLVVLDNCEHLLEPAAEMVELLEHECPGLVLLATSREGLGVEGERMLPVPSLPTPSPDAGPDAAGQADAVRLFVERAGAVDPDFSLTADNTAAVVKICRRLDGVPLAIELAAAHVAAMSPAELLQGLARRFDTLAGGRRRAVQRHQTLRAAIDWSYDLLSEDERRLLARLAVFAGGCTRQAAEVVCGGDPLAPEKLFKLLAALVAKSLVVAQRDAPETRYRMSETIREYAEEKLVEYGEIEGLHTSHAIFYCDLAAVLFDQLHGPQQVKAARRIAAEHENLLAAMNQAIDTEDVDLALRLVSNTLFEGDQVGYRLVLPVDAVLQLPGADGHSLYPLALAVAANHAAARGDLDRVEVTGEEALAASERLGPDPDRRVEALVAAARGTAAMAKGNWGEAAEHLQHAATLRERAANFSGVAIAYTMAGNPDAAELPAAQGLEMARRHGGPINIAANLVGLAGALADRDPPRAKALLAESLELHAALDFESPYAATQSTLIAARMADWSLVLKLGTVAVRQLHWAGDRPYLGGILNIAARAMANADPESAAVLQGAARRFAPASALPGRSGELSSSSPSSPASQAAITASFVTDLRRQTTTVLRDTLGDARLHALRAEGEAMDDDQAVEYTIDAITRAAPEEAKG
jgi:predicted ATPase/class 3 adenylate cyclase